jgi:NAD-dependent DNA ligase
MFTRFNRKAIHDRQIDTLIGLSKGLLADHLINQAEVEFLHQWLVQNRQASDNPIILNLLSKVGAILQDGILDRDEHDELFSLLQQLAGAPSEFGELAKTSSLPICKPIPEVQFSGRTFLFTGTCAYGTRKQCHDATEALGGICVSSVTKTLSYLVIGSYVTDSWAHETFGRKIEKAMTYRESGYPLSIITEEHWATSGKL